MGIELNVKPVADIIQGSSWTFIRFRLVKDTLKVYNGNNVFKIFTRFTVRFLGWCCILASLVGYWDAIRCKEYTKDEPKPSIRLKAVQRYCFIHHSYTVVDKYISGYSNDTKYLTKLGSTGVRQEMPDDDVRYHNYYIWVPFFLFLQGLIFRLPHYVWNHFEGGRLKNYICAEIDKFAIGKPDLKTPDAKKWNDGLDNYARVILDYQMYQLNNAYAGMFIICEVLNVTLLLVLMYLTDFFLGGEFRNYPIDVFNHLTQDLSDRTDPLNYIFPKQIKCHFYLFGDGSNVEKRDFFCVLGVNLVNEKIFVFIWMWYMVLLVLAIFGFMYRFMVFNFAYVRSCILRSRLMPKDQIYLSTILEHLSYYDWFVLKRISDNLCNEMRFGEICQHLDKEIRYRQCDKWNEINSTGKRKNLTSEVFTSDKTCKK